MSTAGKVLVVLITLSLVLWIGLMSKVAQVNYEGAELYKKQADELISLEEKYKQRDQANDALKRTIAGIQDQTDEETVRLRTESNDRENLLTASREQQERVRVDLEAQNSALKTAEAGAKVRNQEKAETKKQIADNQAEVEKLKDQIKDQLQTREKLAQEFVRLRAENEKMVKRVSR